MPAHRLSGIVARIEAAHDRGTLESCVADGLASFGIPVEIMQHRKAAASLDAEQRAYANIITGIARIRALSLPPEPADQSDRFGEAGLTERQFDVLNWAAAGKSNGDIATILGQSRRAVDYHMREILRKLRVTSRAQAVAYAMRR